MSKRIRDKRKTIWIDLDNTPHVPFFLPVIRELEKMGIRVVLTARDAFQVCELADQNGLVYKQIGRHFGRNKAMKVVGWIWRSLKMVPFARREKPDLALSHGSRSQVLVANLFRIPTVVIMDYEYSNVPPFTRPKWEIAPEVISAESLPGRTILKYAGIKEDVYVPSFTPDPAILAELGVSNGDILVTARTPATEAHYHNPESEKLFIDLMEKILATPGTKVILLPRNGKQGHLLGRIDAAWFAAKRVVIPQKALNGLNLIYYSDLVLSGGGTMVREAAALGVPAYSFFCGTLGAVDKYLASTGRLVLLSSDEDIREKLKIVRREKKDRFEAGQRPALQQIIGHLESILARESKGRAS